MDNVKDKIENINESMRIKILHQNIKREDNNLINIDERKKISKFEIAPVLQLNVDENLKNSTIEKLRKNLNSSNIFENISEISKQDNNFIDRGVKTSIFESENNRNSKSRINEHDLIKERIERKEMIRKSKNRLEFNHYESMRIKETSFNKNMFMNSNCQSKFEKFLF